jgi:hypothetical protein
MATIRVQFLHFSNLKVPKAALLRKDMVDNSNVVIEELAHRRHELQSTIRNLIFPQSIGNTYVIAYLKIAVFGYKLDSATENPPLSG